MTEDRPDTDSGLWTEVALRARPDAVELISDFLGRFTGNGTVIEPAIQAFGPDDGYSLDAGAPQLIKGYFYGHVPASPRAALRRRLDAAHAGAVVGRLRWRELRQEDWANAWKAHYKVQHIGRIVIRPAWIEYRARKGEIVVSLDPGMAFGTGDHPTTRMCLEAMQGIELAGASVLDLGAGSGILSIAAAALGASHCLALDIEEMAVTATRANLALNSLGGRVTVEHRSLSRTDGASDAIFANIHASAIVALAPDLAAVARPGATLVAGGVIEPRLQETCAALTANGWSIEQVLESGDWRTVVCRRS